VLSGDMMFFLKPRFVQELVQSTDKIETIGFSTIKQITEATKLSEAF
jgi:hypothetical protein